jgi:hypothetical protein
MKHARSADFSKQLLRRSWLAPIALVAACSATHDSSSVAVPTSSSTHALQPDVSRLRDDVAWLADDAREGRRAGTEQGKACADWIAARMKSIGLEPLGVNGYQQEFTVALDPRDGGGSKVHYFHGPSDGPIAHKELWGEADEKCVPLFCSERGYATGPIAFCGYGIEDSERNWNDFEHVDVKAKIALIVRGTPPSSAAKDPSAAADTHLVVKSDGWGGGGSIFTKVMNAKRHGAVGVILAPSTADEPVLRFDAGHAARAGIPAVMIDAALGDELWTGYRDLLREPVKADEFGKPELDEQGRPAGFRIDRLPVGGGQEVTIFADVITGNGPAYNVLGRLKGKDSSRAIVIGAHYDHLGRGGTGSLAPDKTGEIHHGADDNASGTATVLEIARLMKAQGTPPCDVIFALWSGEELGLLGSEYWAEHPTVPLESITANLNLDMVGRAGNGKIQVLGAGTSPDFVEWMKDAGEKSGLELVVSTSGSSLGGSSDHQTFLKRKIPALHLFSGLHADYHKPSDTADKFEADGAAKVAMLGVVLADDMSRETKLAFVEPKVDTEHKEEIKGGFRCWFGSVPSYSYEGKGLYLDGTSAGSPAERAGMLRGDVLMQVGEVKIDSVQDMVYALQHYKPGDVVLAKYVRDGAMQEARVTLSSRELQ